MLISKSKFGGFITVQTQNMRQFVPEYHHDVCPCVYEKKCIGPFTVCTTNARATEI